MLHPTTLTGLVMGTAWDNKLIRVLDEYEITVKGEKRITKRYWACWFSEPQNFQQGDSIQLVGTISAKITDRERTNQDGIKYQAKAIEWHMNDCRVDHSMPVDVIAVGQYDDEIPF